MGVEDLGLNPPPAFEVWLAGYLGQDLEQTRVLLQSRTATHFLIVWSLFESKCCGGYVRCSAFPSLAGDVASRSRFQREVFSPSGSHFHQRYQDSHRFRSLMHGQTDPELDKILALPFARLTDEQLVHLVLWVVYRFRNNIFHGNKGVTAWLQYEVQIGYCIEALQAMVTVCDESAAISA